MNLPLPFVRLRSPSLIEILQKTIEIHGMREFNRLTQTEMLQGVPDPTIIPELGEFWCRARADFDYLSLFFTEIVGHPLMVPELFPKSSGFLFSWLISQQDLQFFPRNSKDNSIYVHRPLVIAVTILMSWFKEILDLAESNAELTPSNRRKIRFLKWTLNHFMDGFQSGVYRKDLLIKFFKSLKNQLERELTKD